MDIDPEVGRQLIRAARSMARMDVSAFAERLGVGEATLKRTEAGNGDPPRHSRQNARGPAEGRVSVTAPDPERALGYGIAFVTTRIGARDKRANTAAAGHRPRRG